MSIRADECSQLLRFLVTVKTYPSPSIKHMETVCTGGITADGSWVRLYPVPFRYLDRQQQYSLYDWVEVRARKRPAKSDKRKESYEPVGADSLRVTGRIGTEGNWRERKRVILPHALPSVESLLCSYELDGTSLGIVKPAEVEDVIVARDDSEWSPKHKMLLQQIPLPELGRARKELEKPGHIFSYRFRCSDSSCNGHTMQVTDWGLSVLYLRTRKLSGESEAVSKTRMKCHELVGRDRDVYLYVGTIYPYKSCVVLGVFSPKREREDGRMRMRFD